jgi:hypothetical protein
VSHQGFLHIGAQTDICILGIGTLDRRQPKIYVFCSFGFNKFM